MCVKKNRDRGLGCSGLPLEFSFRAKFRGQVVTWAWFCVCANLRLFFLPFCSPCVCPISATPALSPLSNRPSLPPAPCLCSPCLLSPWTLCCTLRRLLPLHLNLGSNATSSKRHPHHLQPAAPPTSVFLVIFSFFWLHRTLVALLEIFHDGAGFSTCGARALQLWHTGLASPQHVASRILVS